MEPPPLHHWTTAILPIALLAAGSLCVDSGVVSAARNHGWYFERPNTEASVYGGDEDFVVVTVLSARDSFSTHSRPPIVTVRVDEVLRGGLSRGKHEIEWRPTPFWLPCMVGEGENLRRWENSRLAGPHVGSRFVLGVNREPSGNWWSDASVRWNAESPEGRRARAKVLEWNANVAARRIRERPERERREKLAAEQAKKDRAARERSEQELEQREREWLAFERAARTRSDLDRLVRSSDAVLLAPPPVASAARGSAWGKFALMTPTSWLLAPADSGVSRERVAVIFGQREDSLRARWLAAPPDDRPGKDRGDSLVTIAFLRYAQDRIVTMGPDPYLRPADPLAGILRADEATVRRVREKIAHRGTRPTEPPAPCGAALEEFAVKDSIEACSVGLKLSPVDRRDPVLFKPGLILVSGLHATTEGLTTLDAGSFAPCALPDEQYVHEFRFNTSYRIPPAQMKALLDSLLLLPELAQGRVDPADSVTLALRRIVDGRERIYETTLDGYTRMQVCRILSSVVHGDAYVRSNVGLWWNTIDQRLYRVWDPGPPPEKSAPVFGGTPPTSEPTRGSVVGWLREAQTDHAIPGAMLRMFDPPSRIRTDDEGAFAVRDLPPGRRWVEFSGPYHELSLGFFDFTKGVVDTVVVFIEPNGKTPPPRDTAFDRNESWHPAAKRSPTDGASLVVRVRDERGTPIPRAYVLVKQGGTMFGALADAGGRLQFPAIAPGTGELYVRSGRHEPFQRTIEFRPSTRDSLELTLGPPAR